MEDRLNELIAFSNKLDALFNGIFEAAAGLYPEGNLPRRGKGAVLVHSSLSAFGGGSVPGRGLVPGGVETVAASLARVCGNRGLTVVMPAHSDCGPAELGPAELGSVEPVVFDRRRTTCRCVGVIAESFRKRHGVRRSGHPYLSFCALGPASGKITRGHRCGTGLGPASPLGALERMDALVLMLGTGYETCTALHLAEYTAAEKARANGQKTETVTCHAGIVLPFGTGTVWKCWEDIDYHVERFPATGLAFETAHPEKLRTGAMDNGVWRVLRLRDLVEFSIDR